MKNNLFGESQNMFQRVFAAVRAGFSFGGQRNIYNVFGYPRELRAEDLYAKYERQDITKRVVNAPVDETWSYPPKASTDDAPFKTAWEALTDIFLPWPILAQADKLCAFGPYSVLFLGLPGDPASKAGKTYKAENVAYMQAYGGSSVTIEQWEKNPSNPRYGQPLLYSLRTKDSTLQTQAHYSRVVHIVDEPLQGSIMGIPRLTVVYNLLDDLLKVGGGSAETYWLTANRGMQVDVDKEMDLDDDDARALASELDEFQHNLRRYIRTRGVTVTPLGSDVADPTGVFSTLMSLLASATNIPQRILMGAEAGQLASAQDRANWSEYINRRRASFAEPYMLTPFVRRLAELGILPILQKPVEWEWPEAFHQNPLEIAQTQAQFARSVVNLSRQTQMQFPLATLKECRISLGLKPEVETGDSLPKAYEPPAPTMPFGGKPTAKPDAKSGKSAQK